MARFSILPSPNEPLAAGLTAIRAEYQVPDAFPVDVLAAAAEAARRIPADHVDRTDRAFVTLDPSSSTDLDQAFAIELAGSDVLLHYAIADVAWFIDDGGVIDAEAWRRGTTTYLPDGKAGLYPPSLSEGAASLLPDGPRPAVTFIVRVAPDGTVRLDGVERAIIRSRAKLAYDRVADDELPPGFAELAARIEAAEQERGASRVDPPEQEVVALGGGRYQLHVRPRVRAEAQNAALSLACNLAVADALQAHHTGLFRVMAEPDARAISRLRHTADALGVAWPTSQPFAARERTLDPSRPADAALMIAIRRAGRGASYVPWRADVTPWHSAMAATYAHATAPLRRLADRYVVEASLAIANGRAVPDAVTAAFPALPPVMARADARSAQIDRAVIDLAEAVLLHDRIGEIFAATVTDIDERGARIQLAALPVVTRIATGGLSPGSVVKVRLEAVDVARRTTRFTEARPSPWADHVSDSA